MTALREDLPFPRGSTLSSDGGSITLDDTSFDHLEGRLYVVEDTLHSTGEDVVLRVVKNDSGAAITVANKLFKFATTSDTDLGRRVSGINDSAGGICKPLDDAYTLTSIADDDLFYVVEEGLCNVLSEASAVSLSAGDSVASDASGLVNGAAAAAGEYVVGVIQEAATAINTEYLVRVSGGVSPPPAAG